MLSDKVERHIDGVLNHGDDAETAEAAAALLAEIDPTAENLGVFIDALIANGNSVYDELFERMRQRDAG